MHHSSIDKKIRLWVEHRLRKEELKVVVCTSSLDLGVDFSPVENCVQIGSPKGVGRFIQRAGRSGHSPKAASNIHFLPTHAMELIESIALQRGIEKQQIEDRIPFLNCYDVLLQFLMTLAVGTGFHPELTGRENVYINGAILGMTRREVDAKFDEIVEFSGVSDFVDTPIKRYSSGMTVRLGFAVAAHLDPDILIVDEVLAVGDLRFQNRCIKQMQKIANSGKTVLFVSHQMTTVENLCKSAFLLSEGRIIYQGPAAKVISIYRDRETILHSNSLSERVSREGNGNCKLIGFEFRNASHQKIDSLICGQTAYIILNFEVICEQKNRMCLSLGISTNNQNRIAHLCMKTFGQSIEPTSDKTFEVRLKLPKVQLNQGNYKVTTFLDDESGEILDWVVDAFTLNVSESDFYGTGMIPRIEQSVFLMEYSFE